MRKSNTWLWLALIVLACVVWIRGIYGTTKSVIISQSAPISEDKPVSGSPIILRTIWN